MGQLRGFLCSKCRPHPAHSLSLHLSLRIHSFLWKPGLFSVMEAKQSPSAWHGYQLTSARRLFPSSKKGVLLLTCKPKFLSLISNSLSTWFYKSGKTRLMLLRATAAVKMISKVVLHHSCSSGPVRELRG